MVSGARSLQNNLLLDGIDNISNLPDLLNEANYVGNTKACATKAPPATIG
jgi:hypothetical protein